MSNSFFDTSSYLKSDSLFDFNKSNKNENENKNEQEEDKVKGFLDNFKEGALGYFKDAQKGKSDTDKLLDFARETRGMGSGAQFGGMGSGFSTEVAQGLNIYQPPSTQQMFIPGKEGKQSFAGRMAGAALSGLGGAVGAGIGKAAIGLLCDIRAKKDIASLNESDIEIHDDLSECAYFVKDLQSGMFG